MTHQNQLDLLNEIENPVKILSVGTYLPTEVVKSDDMFSEIDSKNRYDIATDWMSSEMGIIERRVAPVGALPSSLAIPAAKKAIDSAKNINPSDIGMIIFCGIERDQSEPATAHTIQSRLGLTADHAFDVSNACFGFMHGVEIASNYIKCGIVRYALVVTGEIPSRVMRAALAKLKNGVGSKKEAMNIVGALSVGDAGGAVLLGAAELGENCGFQFFKTKSDSSHVDKCYYRVKSDGEIDGQMKMGPIVGASIWMHRKIIQDTLHQLGWCSFDWVLSHQTGRRPFEKFSSFSTVAPERMIKTFPTLGNIATATFPINFEKLVNNGKVRIGDKIGGIHSGSGLVVGEFGYRY